MRTRRCSTRFLVPVVSHVDRLGADLFSGLNNTVFAPLAITCATPPVGDPG